MQAPPEATVGVRRKALGFGVSGGVLRLKTVENGKGSPETPVARFRETVSLKNSEKAAIDFPDTTPSETVVIRESLHLVTGGELVERVPKRRRVVSGAIAP